jgi:triacylglycerol lipase
MGTPMIAVSLNYRLHCWGFMWSQEIKHAGVGNLGFRDQRLALYWIQESMHSEMLHYIVNKSNLT